MAPKQPRPVTLAEWLVVRGRTQVWLAQALGLSIAQTSRIVRGAAMPRAPLALRITKLTGLTGDDLLRARAAHTPDNRSERLRQAKRKLTAAMAEVTAITEESA